MNSEPGSVTHQAQPAKKSYRRIATEEAFAIPEQMDAMRAIVAHSKNYDPDLFLWTLAGGTLYSRLPLSFIAEREKSTGKTGMTKSSVSEKRLSTLHGLILLLLVILSTPARAQVSIVTERYDNSRTGANLNETVLNTSNVNTSQFGLLYRYTVDGSIQAQPLYVPNVTVAGQGTHNVLYVVTMNDVIYAFDADSNSVNGGVLWSLDFRNPTAGITPIPITDIVGNNNLNIVGNVGIESTPVIDLSSQTLYLVARTKEVSGSTTNYVARLHALDITKGSEKFGGPVVIQASVPGSGQGSSGGTLVFDSLHHNQRSSLALANGLVLFSWASHEDLSAWHGWVMAYNAQTLAQSSVFCSTPNGMNGGMWMAGRAPVVDASGNVYYATGNGDWDGISSFGDSVLKLSTTGGILSRTDYFTPDDYAILQSSDLDLGSSGPLLIPGTSLLLQGGKESVLYLMSLSNLGHEQSGNNQIVQHFTTTGSEIKGGPVFWNRITGAGPTMYVWPENISLQAYQFSGSTFNVNPISQSGIVAPSGSSGGVLTLSANGSAAGTGIVWSSMPLNQNGDHGTVTGVLRAFDANSLTNELWDSQMNSTRDAMGLWPKYSPPTVVNGKVYMASFSGVVSVYGLFSSQADFTLSAAPSSQSVNPGGSTSYTVSAGAVNGFSGSVSLSASGLPAGATASFNPSSVATGASSTLTITTTASTPVGSSTLTITGTSGSLTHTATVTLNVTSSSGSSGKVISIDFVGQDVPMAATEVAGVVAKANWNNASGASSSAPLALVDETGSSTTATVSWSSNNIWETQITDQAGNARMMKGYLDTASGTPTTVNFTGLPSNAASYNVYVYADGDNPNGSRTGIYQISGAGITTTSISLTDVAGTNFSGTFTQGNNSAGNYVVFTINATSFTISGTPGSSTDAGHRAPINGIQVVPVGQDFTLSAAPSSQSVNPGGSTSYTVSAGALNGFSGSVSLSASGLPAGATASFNPSSVATGASSTLTITTTASTPVGSSTLTITGTSGSLSHTATVTLNVTAASDFTLSATPSSQSVNPGGSTSYTVSAGALNGFSGSVSLSASGLPAGATASFNPSSVATGASSTLTITTTASTPVGSSTLTITGTSGSLSHTATVTLNVTAASDFTLSATPSSQSVNPGGSTSYTVSAGALNGFSGSVSLSASGLPAGATASFNPSSVATGASSTLTITTTASTPVGSSTLTITGTSGSLTHTATVTLNVTSSSGSSGKVISIDFVGQDVPMAATEVAGVVAKANWNNASGASSSAPLALVDETGSSTTATVSWSSNNIWETQITDQAGNARMMKGYLDTASGTPTTVNFTGLPSNAASYNVYVYADGDNPNGSRTGIYQISGAGITTTSISLTDVAGTNFSGTFTQGNNSAGNYVVFTINATSFTISGTPGSSTDAGHRAPINGIQVVPVGQDFTLSAAPSSQSVNPGGSTSYTVSAGALNGFSGSVSLSASGLPAGATASFNPSSVATGASSTLTITTTASTPVGSSTLIITGTSGSLSHTATVTLNVTAASDFTLSATPSSQSVNPGGSTSYTVSAGALNGFSGSVSLSASGLPAGATASFNPSSVATGASSTLTITTTASTPVGSSTLTITGTSGSLSHTATVTLNVTAASDFTLSATPSSQSVNPGGSTSYTVSAGALNGFSGSVSLSASGLPAGATASFNPSSVATGASSTLTITTTASTPVGSSTLTITGTSGSLSHTATVTLNVTAASDFTLSATPSSQSVNPGGSTSYTVSAGALNGFSGSVSLSASGLPAGATASFNPSSVATGASSTLTITTTASTPVGSSTLTITGTSGSLTHTATVTLNVTAASDFTLSATPSSQSVNPGGSTSYTVSAGALNGFSGSVSLSASGLPAGATASFNPSSVATGASSTLTITTTASTPVGSSTLTITGTSGSLSHTATVTLNVTSSSGSSGKVISIDFVGQDVPMAATEVAGVVAKANWNNASGASSSAPLALVDETGSSTTATVSWSSNNIWETQITDQAGNARMMKGYLDTASGTPTTVNFTGLPSNAASYNVYVYADGDNPNGSRTGIYQISGAGITTTSISLTDVAGTNFSGTFTQGNNSAGNYVVFTINATSFTISGTPGSSTDAGHRAPINGIQVVPVGQDFTLSAAPSSQSVNPGGSTSYTVSAGALNGFSGSVSLSASGLPAGATASFNPSSVATGASSTLTITTTASTPVGSSTLTITGTSGSLSHTATVTLNVTAASDFTLSATPSSQSVNPGGSTSYTVSAGALNGFSGSVSLSASGLPAGATASFNPSSVATGASSTLTITTTASTPVGSSTLTITGTSGSLSHTATVTLNVTAASDFTLSATPSSQSVNPGGSTSYTVSAGALNGFSGSVSLSASGLPAGATASFNPSSVATGASSTLTITTTASTPVGSSTLTITGTSGSLTHTATVTLNVTSSSGSSGKVISIDFVGQDVPMAATEVAGVVAKANWNNASGASSSAPLALVDETGSSTTATVSWSSNNIWETQITDQAGNARMMKGYLDTASGTPTTVNFTGLPSNAASYNVYVYADGDNPNGSRTGIYQISGAGITTTSISLTDVAGTNFSGTFTQGNNSAGNYVVFTINATSFTISGTPGSSTDAGHRAPINGIQVVPVGH